MKRIFGGSTLSYGATWQSLAWQYFAKAGIKKVDLRVESYAPFSLTPELMFDEPWHGMWQISIPDLKDMLKKIGVTAVATLANCDICYREGVDLVKKRMEFSKKMRVKHFVTAPWSHYDKIRGSERIMYDHWKELSDYADMLGLELCVETHAWTTNNARECLETIRNVGRKNFRVCFATSDTYYRNTALDQTEELKLLGEHIGLVFLRDFRGETGKWDFPALGDGIVDFPKLFVMLDEFGFTGPYLLVLEGHSGTVNASMDRYHEDVVKSISYLKDIGVSQQE